MKCYIRRQSIFSVACPCIHSTKIFYPQKIENTQVHLQVTCVFFSIQSLVFSQIFSKVLYLYLILFQVLNFLLLVFYVSRWLLECVELTLVIYQDMTIFPHNNLHLQCITGLSRNMSRLQAEQASSPEATRVIPRCLVLSKQYFFFFKQITL